MFFPNNFLFHGLLRKAIPLYLFGIHKPRNHTHWHLLLQAYRKKWFIRKLFTRTDTSTHTLARHGYCLLVTTLILTYVFARIRRAQPKESIENWQKVKQLFKHIQKEYERAKKNLYTNRSNGINRSVRHNSSPKKRNSVQFARVPGEKPIENFNTQI